MEQTEIPETLNRLKQIGYQTAVAMEPLAKEIDSLLSQLGAERERAKPFGAADEAAKRPSSGEI